MIVLILLFTVVPITELMLLFKAGDAIGGLNTVAIVLLTGVAGAALAKSQGLALLAKIQEQMNRGELPGETLLQGFMVFGGGLLLLTPGFLTDILGFLMVLPGTRLVFAQLVKAYFLRKIQTGQVQVFGGGFRAGGFRSGGFSEGFQRGGNLFEGAMGREFESDGIRDAKVTQVRDVTDSGASSENKNSSDS